MVVCEQKAELERDAAQAGAESIEAVAQGGGMEELLVNTGSAMEHMFARSFFWKARGYGDV